MAVGVHAPIGLRNVLREWTGVAHRAVDILALGFGGLLLVIGMRAIWAAVRALISSATSWPLMRVYREFTKPGSRTANIPIATRRHSDSSGPSVLTYSWTERLSRTIGQT